jgi:hypothetical protein
MKTEIVGVFDYDAQMRYFKQLDINLNTPLSRISRRSMLADERTGGLSGDVIGDSIVAYDASLTAEQRQVVGDSLLFAEMRADAVCSNNRDNSEKWYKAFSDALKACGWYQPEFSFSDFKSRTTKLTVNKAILQILETIAGPNPVKILSLMSTAFDSLKEDEAGLKLVESKSKQNKGGTIKGVPCIIDGGQLTVLMACLHLQSKDVLVNGFWGEYDSQDLQIYRAAGKRLINQDAFNYVRDRVRAYIYGSQDDYFKNIG